MTERTRQALIDIRTDLTKESYPSAATRVWEWIWALDDVIGDQPVRRQVPEQDRNGGLTCYDDSPYAKKRGTRHGM